MQKALVKNDEIMHEAALAAVAKHGPAAAKDAIPAMVKAVDNPVIFSVPRSRIVRAIGEMGPTAKDAVPDLIRFLRGKEPFIKGAAVTALGRIGPDARQAILDLIASVDGQGNQFREAVFSNLAKIGPEDPRVTSTILIYLGDRSLAVQATAEAV